MIHYALRCGGGHEFDGWFNSSQSFDIQAQSGLLDCPVCADTAVTRALMAPRLSPKGMASKGLIPKGKVIEAEPAETPAPAKPPETAEPRDIAVLPDQLRAALQRIRSEVEQRCDYVGDRFASEARKIHRGETEERPIYGQATPEEAEALADDGIEVARLPWVPRADS